MNDFNLIIKLCGSKKSRFARTSADNALLDKEFNTGKNPKYHAYHCGLALLLYKFFDKKSSATRANKCCDSGAKSEFIRNQELAK